LKPQNLRKLKSRGKKINWSHYVGVLECRWNLPEEAIYCQIFINYFFTAEMDFEK
jgi:hypothetical protein